MAKTYRIDDLRNSALNLSLPSYKPLANGGRKLNHEDWQLVIQVRILRELEKLNALLACPNFIGMPQTLREINYAVSRIPAIARPRKPKIKKAKAK